MLTLTPKDRQNGEAVCEMENETVMGAWVINLGLDRFNDR